jgi:RNA polymerase sigma factor (sigma-70 family)
MPGYIMEMRNKDKNRFEAVWVEMEPRISSFLYSKGCPTDDIPDLLQETAVRACRRIHLVDENIEPWLWKITRHVFSEYVKRRIKYPMTDESPELQDYSYNPDSKATTHHLFLQILNDLDPIDSKIIINYYSYGLKLREISEIVGKSVSNCHYRIERAKKLIREMYPELCEFRDKEDKP